MGFTDPNYWKQSPPPQTGDMNNERYLNQKAVLELPGAQAPQELSIADGRISPTRSAVIVDTEGGGAADDLEVINTAVGSGTETLHPGMIIGLRAKDPARTVTVKNSAAANGINTAGGHDVVLSTEWDLVLRLVAGRWYEIQTRGDVRASDAQTDASTAIARTAPATTTSRGIGRVAAVADEVTIANGPAFLAAGTDGAFKQAARAKYMTTGNFNLLTPGTYICDNAAEGITNAPPNFSRVFVYTKTWVPSEGSVILYDEARSFDGLVRVAHRTFVPSRGTWSAWVEENGKANTDLSNITNNAIRFYFCARDEKPSGTTGGSNTANAWMTRDVNTVVHNSIAGAYLSANGVTLPAGRYYIEARMPVALTEKTRGALYNVTSSSYMIYSPSVWAQYEHYEQTPLTLNEEITLTEQSTLELRMWASRSYTNGCGFPSGVSGVPEIYSELRIWKM